MHSLFLSQETSMKREKDELRFSDNHEQRKRRRLIIKIVMWIVEIAAMVGLAYVICAFCVEKTTVIGDSMNPILADGDKILINKIAYRFSDPKRYDVICFKQSGKEHSFYNIKRVIGLPGETVSIIDGKVYIDGEELIDDMNVDEVVNGGLANEEILLEENEYFVLGDNRNNSEDSRFANIGNIVESDIIGKAWIKLDGFHFIDVVPEKEEEDE